MPSLFRGHSLAVKPQPSKLVSSVRFRVPAPSPPPVVNPSPSRTLLANPFRLVAFIFCAFPLFWVAGCKQPTQEGEREPEPGQNSDAQFDPSLDTDLVGSPQGTKPSGSSLQVDPQGIAEVDDSNIQISPDDSLAYVDGQLFTGRAKSFYENGQQATEVNYVEGMRDGLESRWYESGVKKFEARFHNNRLVGVYEEWYDNGKKKTERVWQDGKAVSVKEWSPEGELVRDN